jgi:hypothetical protein
VDVLGIDHGADIGVDVANLGFYLLFGEALAIGGDRKAVGQFQCVFAASATDHLLVGMNAVREPEIDKLANRWHFSPSDQAEHERLSVTGEADGEALMEPACRNAKMVRWSILLVPKNLTNRARPQKR